MSKVEKSESDRLTPRQIVGFSMTPELASKVKAEAGRRSLSLKKLFEEMWSLYEKSGKESRS